MTSLSLHLEIRKVVSSHHDSLSLKLRVTLVSGFLTNFQEHLKNLPVKLPTKISVLVPTFPSQSKLPGFACYCRVEFD